MVGVSQAAELSRRPSPEPVASASDAARIVARATAVDAEELYPDKVERVPAEEPFPAFLDIDAEGGPITAYLGDADAITNLEAGTPCGE